MSRLNATLELRMARVEAENSVERLQYAYGYFIDNCVRDEAFYRSSIDRWDHKRQIHTPHLSSAK